MGKQTPSWLAPHLTEVVAWPAVRGEQVPCLVAACDRSPHLHGLCRVHYFRAYRLWRNPRQRPTTSPGTNVPGDNPKENDR